MQVKKILPDLSVSPQIKPDDIAELVALGFKSIICNRPDNEGPGQPSVADVQAMAEQQGLQFLALPFSAGKQSAQDIREFAQALQTMPGPVLAYCRTGTRSAKIWAQGYAAGHSVEEAIRVAAQAGLDLSADQQMLEAGVRALKGDS